MSDYTHNHERTLCSSGGTYSQEAKQLAIANDIAEKQLIATKALYEVLENIAKVIYGGMNQ